MPQNGDVNDRVLRALCALGEHREGAVVNARPLAEELAIELQYLFASVLVLVENDRRTGGLGKNFG